MGTVALLAGLSAGCSADVSRFDSLFASTDNRSAIVRHDQVVTGSLPPQQPLNPAPVEPVVTAQLPPPGATSSAPVINRLPVMPSPGGAGSGWSTVGGTRITVQSGETLELLSRRYGVPLKAIADANGLPSNAPLAPGQALIIPTYSHGAPPVAAAPNSTSTQVQNASAGEIYVVQPGDSLGKIANARGMRSTELAAANGIDPAAPIRVGQKLKIPTMGGTQVAALTPATATDVAPMPPAVPGANQTTLPQPSATPVASAAPVQEAALTPATSNPISQGTGVESSATGGFRWPVRGRVISNFGVKPGGARNDGINIEVPEGTPIKAAEGGTVIYAGDDLKGYGNLVLIKHPNGFVSAYAHASEILVKRDDVIMRGQTIAKAGTTGNVSRPQLHFELRQGNKPVDPLPYLSG